MADLLPLFPLPNVVLFPNVFLPLHVFEPRYREMITDAISSDRMVGMVLLRPGWERDYEGRPPIYPVGCSGVLTHVDRLTDGRFNVVLRGLERFRIVSEDHGLTYRRATIEPLLEPRPAPEDHAVIQRLRARLDSILTPAIGRAGADTTMPPAMSDEDLVNALAQYLDLEALEKQALLERPCLRTRAAALVELLEMKTMMARAPGLYNVAH